MSCYVYVTVDTDIATFSMDPASGKLALERRVDLGKSGYATTDSRDKTLYVGLQQEDAHSIGSYRIDPTTGDLTPLGEGEAEAMPCYLFVDPTDRFLLAAYYLGGMATVHALAENGSVGAQVDKQVTEQASHFIATDHSNRFAFVPHVAEANAIYQFQFDAGSGQLTPNPAAPKLTNNAGLGPRHLAFHPTLDDIVYADNEQGSSVTVHRLNKEAGTLEPLQTVSTLPEGGHEGNSNAQIQIHPSGKSLYVTNRGHDSIAMFAIDADGGIRSLGQQSSVKVPRAMDIAPGGGFLYAGGDESNKLVAYEIGDEGVLEPLYEYDLGGSANWIYATELD